MVQCLPLHSLLASVLGFITCGFWVTVTYIYGTMPTSTFFIDICVELYNLWFLGHCDLYLCVQCLPLHSLLASVLGFITSGFWVTVTYIYGTMPTSTFFSLLTSVLGFITCGFWVTVTYIYGTMPTSTFFIGICVGLYNQWFLGHCDLYLWYNAYLYILFFIDICVELYNLWFLGHCDLYLWYNAYLYILYWHLCWAL